MLLSIVIPTYNRFAYLKQCLDALMPQISGDSDTEIWIIDDNSGSKIAEKNAALCRETGAGYVLLNTNQGAAAARNSGMRRSAGQWIAFLDDDVSVARNWHAHCRALLQNLPANVVGIEGKVIASGSGLWDREVENVHGGLYLSCHMLLKKDLVLSIGGFDENFKSRYPSGEDHELAARVLLRGDIVFEPGLCVRHLPRAVHFWAHMRDSSYRMRSQLRGELYFFCKHRDRYHEFRHAATFWGTYANILVKHTVSTLRRRALFALAAHPVQLVLLILSSMVEQATAFFMLPCCVALFKRGSRSFFEQCIDCRRTLDLWKLRGAVPLSKFRLPAHFVKSVLFPLTRKPVYSIASVVRGLSGASSHSRMRVFLRIDDVLLARKTEVESLCNGLSKRKSPFCAAITGNDLMSAGNSDLIRLVGDSGGEIALHGLSHTGRFGPYDSELLQMGFLQLEAMVQTVKERLTDQSVPKILVPPFNVLGREQIVYLARYFKIICGGPETARFTDCFAGPVALADSSWYFPAFHPFYTTAPNILKSKELGKALDQKGFLCIGLHMPVEARNNFEALWELVDRISEKLTSWKYLFDL